MGGRPARAPPRSGLGRDGGGGDGLADACGILEDAPGGHGRPKPAVNVHHSDAGGGGVEGCQHGGHAPKGGSVAGAGGQGNDRDLHHAGHH